MSNNARNISKKAGLPPGALVHVGHQVAEKVKISVIDFDGESFFETVCKKTEDCFPYKDKKSTSWINIDGLHDTEHYSEALELLEEKVLNQQGDDSLEEIQRIKKQLSSLRKSITPVREVILALQKDSGTLIEEGTNRYLTDVYEHIIQVNETIETQRENVASIMDLYLSGVSNKMNQVMQVLTIIATIFIPLTFITGIYGMNFVNIPELNWKYGYIAVWGVMLAVIIVMIVFFRKKKWL